MVEGIEMPFSLRTADDKLINFIANLTLLKF